MRSHLLLALAVLALVSACFDFTLPEGSKGQGGATSSSATGAASQGGGGAAAGGAASGGGGMGGSAAAGGLAPPCTQYACASCAACMVQFFGGSAQECEAYDACITGCMGDMVCESGCEASHSNGSFLRASIDSECTGVCGMTPPCS